MTNFVNMYIFLVLIRSYTIPFNKRENKNAFSPIFMVIFLWLLSLFIFLSFCLFVRG